VKSHVLVARRLLAGDGDAQPLCSTRVIKAVELIYQAGFLGSILMIGEQKGTLNAIVSEHVKDPKLMSFLEEKLRAVGQKMKDDPWSSSLRTLDSPDHKIIDDENAKVSLYLTNLKMLWRLGVARRGLDDLTDEQIVAIVKCIPGNSRKAQALRLALMGTLARQIKAENEQIKAETTDDSVQTARKFRERFPDLSDEQIASVVKCIPGDSREAEENRVKLLRNLAKQIKAEKDGTPFGLTFWKSMTPEDIAAEINKIIETGTIEDHPAKATLRLVE
jgi:hypothetical protein